MMKSLILFAVFAFSQVNGQVSYTQQYPQTMQSYQQPQVFYSNPQPSVSYQQPQVFYSTSQPVSYQQQPPQLVSYQQQPPQSVTYQQQPPQLVTYQYQTPPQQVVQQAPQKMNEEAKKRLIEDIISWGKSNGDFERPDDEEVEEFRRKSKTDEATRAWLKKNPPNLEKLRESPAFIAFRNGMLGHPAVSGVKVKE